MHLNFPLMGALAHAYVAARLVQGLGLPPAGLALGLSLVASGAWLTPKAMRGNVYRADGRPDPLGIMAQVWIGFFSSLLVLTVLRDLMLLFERVLVHFFTAPEAVQAVQAAGAAASAWVVLGVATLVTAVGFSNARRTASVVRVDVPIEGLSRMLHGFTIAQVSDLHVGPTIRRTQMQRLVAAVNGLKPDAIAITGDLVDGSVHDLAPHVAPLRELSARHGVYVATGNHEYYAGALPWIEHLTSLGLRVLLNEHVVLRVGSALAQTDEDEGARSLVLAGVCDYDAVHFVPEHRTDPFKALEGAPMHAGVRVLLAHQPRSAKEAEEAGFDLQLSGHTHGGQIWPWGHLVILQQPFTAGLYRLRKMWVYVSRGTGYWGPPTRLGAPSEITLIRLVTA